VISKSRRYADVCVIDDCSTDSSSEIIDAIDDIHVIHHARNTHIAQGILDGMAYAVEKGYTHAITMDAGLSHNPDEIPLFLKYDGAHVVLGRRVIKMNTPFHRRALSAIGCFVYNVFLDFPRINFNPYYGDLTTGFRKYSREAMELLLATPIKSRSFDFLFESTMHIYKSGMTIAEVPITYNFSNSSLNMIVIFDCIKMVLRSGRQEKS